MDEFINLTMENIASEHLCCLIRKKVKNIGVENKRCWLKNELTKDHVFRKLNVDGCVFIEYAPLETSWVSVQGTNYLYLYCLWVDDPFRGKGYAKSLMEYCIHDAKNKGKSGICMLGAKKQKHWLSDQGFAEKYGFKVVDQTSNGYQLYALSFDGTYPSFSPSAKLLQIDEPGLVIYYDDECPYIHFSLDKAKETCEKKKIPYHFIHVDSFEMAKNLPCIFNNYAVFYQGKFITVNLLDTAFLSK